MALSTLTHSLITVSVMSRDLGILLILVTRARMFLAWRLTLPALSWKRSTRPVSTFTMAVRSASRRVTHACSIITLSAGDNSGAILAASAWERALTISSKRKQGSFFIRCKDSKTCNWGQTPFAHFLLLLQKELLWK